MIPILLLLAQFVMPSRVNPTRVATIRDLTTLVGTPYIFPPPPNPASRMLPYRSAIHPARIRYADGPTLRLWGKATSTVTAPRGDILVDWSDGTAGICGSARRRCNSTWRIFSWTGKEWRILQ